MSANKLDIVLPCYNPEKDWAGVVIQMMNQIFNQIPKDSIHLIIVNDGSTIPINEKDISAIQQAVPDFTFLSYEENKGKGFALRHGVQQTKHHYCIYTDIDFPYSSESFFKIYDALLEGNDVAISARQNNYYDSTPFIRKIISKSLKSVISMFLKLPTTDTQAGLKGFNSKGRRCFLKTTINRYLFDLEFIHLVAHTTDVRYKIVSVELREGIEFSKMNLSILISEAINFFKILIYKLK